MTIVVVHICQMPIDFHSLLDPVPMHRGKWIIENFNEVTKNKTHQDYGNY